MKTVRIFAAAMCAVVGCQSPAPHPAMTPATPGVTTAPGGEVDRRQGRSAPVGNEAAPTEPETRTAQGATSDSAVQPPTGHPCRVYLRRDALGMAGAAPLAPNLDAPMQRGTVVSGILDQVTDSWIVLKSDGGRIWIPRNTVLMLAVLDR
ncbi:MAG TPA: hypothetical protein VGI81_12270 [Tepidisphaeraceae bacterium]